MTLEVVNKRPFYEPPLGPMVTNGGVHKDKSILMQSLLSPP
jgi:hypothetical protein